MASMAVRRVHTPVCTAAGRGSSVFQGLLDGVNPMLHPIIEHFLGVVGQRVGCPNESGSALLVAEDFKHTVVVRPRAVDDRPAEPSGGVVDADQTFAEGVAVGEGDDSVFSFQAARSDVSGREPRVERSEVAGCVPDFSDWHIDHGLFANGCHPAPPGLYRVL
jgi:hypothetical protein